MVRKTPKVVIIPGRVGPQQKKQQKKKKVTPMGQLIRAAGGYGGKMLGGYFGAPTIGGAAGTQLGALASKWLGFGAYRVARNSILTDSTMGVPAMHSTGQSILVRHKEFVGTIKGSVDFKTQYALPLNPGMEGSFPWLAGVAQRYQEYAIKGMVFHYIPTSGVAVSGTNPALGSVMIQTTYRASDAAPFNKTEMMNEYCASEAVPSEPFIHPIECDPKENPFNVHYVRSRTPPTGEPLMSYDLGKTFVSTVGMPANGNVVGDLWVTYEVELKKPVVSTSVSGNGYNYSVYTGGSNTTLFTGITAGVGNVDITGAANILTISAGGPRTLLCLVYFPTGNFTSVALTLPTVTNGKLLYCNLVPDTLAYTNTGSGRCMWSFVVSRTDPTQDTFVDFTGKVTMTGTFGTTNVSAFAVDNQLPGP